MHIDSTGRRTFAMRDVTEWSGATAPQMEWWVNQGLIVPLQGASGRGTERVFSLQNTIEAAMARELAAAGIAVKQLQGVFAQLRERLEQLPPELRAAGVFVRYVEMVDAIVTINGPGPNYAQWRRDVTAFMKAWPQARRRPQKAATLDDQILKILAASRVADKAADDQTRTT